MSLTRVSVVDYHTGGEPFRIVTDGVPVVRWDDVAAVHVRMATRLEDEQAPVSVEALEGEAAPFEDRRPLHLRDAVRDDAERLAAGVVVDHRDPRGAHSSEKLGYRCVRSRR